VLTINYTGCYGGLQTRKINPMKFSEMSTDERELLTGAVQIAIAEQIVADEIAARLTGVQVDPTQILDAPSDRAVMIKQFHNLN